MAMKNKYAYRSRISEAKIRQLVKLFSVDLTASQIAELSGVNRNTVNRYVTAFRERIARYCEAESPVKGEVEVDESYFGARRVRGIRGRGARGKTIVFGLTGTGYFDMVAYEKFHNGEMSDYLPTDADLEASFAKLPKVPGCNA